MAQRGGSVLSTVRFGEQVWSPVSPHADVVIATELLEGRRGLDLLGAAGHAGLRRHHAHRSGQRAARARRSTRTTSPAAAARRGVRAASPSTPRRSRGEAGTVRAANVALLGAASAVLPFSEAAWQRGLEAAVPAKILDVNQRAFALGRAAVAQRGGRAVKVTQLTVFLENRSGRLAEVADILGKAGINIRGFSTTEAAEYGIVRLIVTDPERARELLHDAGFTTHFSQVDLRASRPTSPAGSPACSTSSPPPASPSTTSTASPSRTSASRCATSTAPSSCSRTR